MCRDDVHVFGVPPQTRERKHDGNSSLTVLLNCLHMHRHAHMATPMSTNTTLPCEITKYRVAQKERMFFNLPAISFFGVTSNQKSTFENLV